jgi:hypothetical protein
MARVHELKCWPEFFEGHIDKTKTFELRKDDRGFQVGDFLWLREWNPKENPPVYTNREALRKITGILHGSKCPVNWGLAKDYVILSLSHSTIT